MNWKMLVPVGICVLTPWTRQPSLLANDVCQTCLDSLLAFGPVMCQYSKKFPVVESMTKLAVTWDCKKYLGVVCCGVLAGYVSLPELSFEFSLGTTCSELRVGTNGWDVHGGI